MSSAKQSLSRLPVAFSGYYSDNTESHGKTDKKIPRDIAQAQEAADSCGQCAYDKVDCQHSRDDACDFTYGPFNRDRSYLSQQNKCNECEDKPNRRHFYGKPNRLTLAISCLLRL